MIIVICGTVEFDNALIIVRRAQALRKGEKFDEKADKAIVEMVEQAAEQMSLALVASSMLTDDGIIDPRDTRTVLGLCLSLVNNKKVEGASEFGVFRL